MIARLLLCALVLSSAKTVNADSGGASAAMNDYFAGEKRGGLVLVGLGAAGLGAGAVLATRDSDIARGAGYVGLGIGAIHVAAGVFVYVASAGRITTFEKEIADDESGFASRERERIRGVQRQFFALKIAEVALMAGGAGLAIYGVSSDRDLATGIGVGLAVEAAATLVFDIVAARRADRYLGRLLHVSAARFDGAKDSHAFGLALSGAF